MNMEEFLKKKAKCDCGCKKEGNTKCPSHHFDDVTIEDLGMFYWERSGKQFVINWSNPQWLKMKGIKHYIKESNKTINLGSFMARDFQDCIACLGEKKVKKLIKEMKP